MNPIVLLLGTALLMQTAATLKPGTKTAGDVALVVAAIPRFTPDRFVALPPSVRDAFTAMNCQVPQNALSTGPSNVIDGEFAANGQRDWAALCSNGTVSEIRIVWGGPVRCEDRLASRQDSDSLTKTAPGTYAFARWISIRPRGSADAIDDNVANRPRLVHACVNGRWILEG
jgi:hypothetical protein